MSRTASLEEVRSLPGMEARVGALDWDYLCDGLDADGACVVRGLLSEDECDEASALYGDEQRFRSKVIMARHGYGEGEYKYFRYPLPSTVTELRTHVWPKLAPVANRWNEAMRIDVRYPGTHAEFVQRCHDSGQVRPTPLMLNYGSGDYNCLHQDLYGEHVFPLQLAILLSQPGRDFTGGEFVLTEQRPRRQSRPQVLPLAKGDAAIFAVHHRPVQGTRGYYRVNMRHGVSRITTGNRRTLGIIFHDAR
ncbi:MAG TPA: 2OG-Fe(II) oxygenase [Woeseiaceae bacterium]|nr:2OG-Fe(II) oxygenase [Woeseiaceae bacterium]